MQIRASEEVEAPPPAEADRTVTPFSCGLDSSYTVLRHRRALAGRRTRHLAAGVVMHGYDIRLDQENAVGIFHDLLTDVRTVLDSVGLDCIPMTSNFHELQTNWFHSFGVHLVSGLRLLAGRFGASLIPNTTPYWLLEHPWGSHPACDPHLSSRNFQVIDDGADAGRVRKAEVVSQWPEAIRHLRVCAFDNGVRGNCCVCAKCLQTILAFRVAGRPVPPTFSRDITDRHIRAVRLAEKTHHQLSSWREIVFEADRRGLGGTGWAKAARAMIRRNRLRWAANRLRRPFLPLRNAIRTVLRGSPLSRGELAERAAADAQRSSSRS